VAVAAHARAALRAGGFVFALPAGSPAVFTGGTMATARAIFATAQGKPLTETSAVVSVPALRDLLDRLAPLTLAQRKQTPGLPPERADVFPAALATVIAVAEAGNLATFHHSFYNLRFGLAAEELAKLR
jgi:exopolyphosphatase/guanosine-5'-triphosphate,3'-diphosphate pyrophosphatase